MTGPRLPPIWVIYDHPTDYPDYFVVRCWFSPESAGPPDLAVSLEEARTMIHLATHGQAVCLGRNPGDDPNIVEAWI